MNEKVLIIVVVIIAALECILIPLLHWIEYKRDCKKYGKDKVDGYYKKWRDD